jgi:hypothetical protein
MLTWRVCCLRPAQATRQGISTRLRPPRRKPGGLLAATTSARDAFELLGSVDRTGRYNRARERYRSLELARSAADRRISRAEPDGQVLSKQGTWKALGYFIQLRIAQRPGRPGVPSAETGVTVMLRSAHLLDLEERRTRRLPRTALEGAELGSRTPCPGLRRFGGRRAAAGDHASARLLTTGHWKLPGRRSLTCGIVLESAALRLDVGTRRGSRTWRKPKGPGRAAPSPSS